MSGMDLKSQVLSPVLRLLLPALALNAFVCSASFSFNFYAASCPAAELLVSGTVKSFTLNDPTVPGKLLRLLFHDCFVEGCDASVLLQGNKTERTDPANLSLGGFSVIDSAKRSLEAWCPGTVSCSDILALAARDAVSLTGGPFVQIPTGRRDGKVSAAANVRPNIVDTSFTMKDMAKLFISKGLTVEDVVTLSGAHTIGSAHCDAFSERFEEDKKGNLKPIDSSLDTSYADTLMSQCPANASPSTTVNNDVETPTVFDNQYYQNLLVHKGLFLSDSVLLNNPQTRQLVEDYAGDQGKFFSDWSQSFFKLTSIGVKTGDEGEVRRNCSFVNG